MNSVGTQRTTDRTTDGREGAADHEEPTESGIRTPDVPDEEANRALAGRRDGPWDETETAPELERVDLGSLWVPVAQQLEIQLNVVNEEIVAATVTYETNTLQLQAFAAPKSGGLWEDARQEIASELVGADRETSEIDGPFGKELRTRLPVQTEGGVVPQPARFVGVDGRRWLLRGVFVSPGGVGSPQEEVLEGVFRGTIVARGDAPMPPRERLPLQVPPDAEQSAAAGAEADSVTPPATVAPTRPEHET